MTTKETRNVNPLEIKDKASVLDKASGLGLSGLDLGKYAGISAIAKASGLGWTNLNFGKEIGITALTAKALGFGLSSLNLGKTAGITSLAAKTSHVGLAGLDLGKNSGIVSLAAKASGIGLAGLDLGKHAGITALAAKAYSLCLPDFISGKNFGMAALAAKASSIGWANRDLSDITGIAALATNASKLGTNSILTAAMRGIDIKAPPGLFASASKVAVPTSHNHSRTMSSDLKGIQPILENLLSSSAVEEAFENLLEEKDFEKTTIRLLSQDTNLDSMTIDGTAIEPFHKNQSFGEWYDKLRPVHQQGIALLLTALITIFLGYFVNITTPYVDDFIHGHPHETKAIVKSIKKLSYNHTSLESDFRFVSATRLHIREKARIDSAIIATASLGKVVKVELKKQAWAKISYLDENNDLVCGWTLLRYITKFKY